MDIHKIKIRESPINSTELSEHIFLLALLRNAKPLIDNGFRECRFANLSLYEKKAVAQRYIYLCATASCMWKIVFYPTSHTTK